MTELDSLPWRMVAVASAVAPATALIAYFYFARAWRHLRELIFISFGFGFGSAIPIAGISALYAPEIARITALRPHAAAVAFFEASIPEELGKLLIVICIILRHEDLRRPVDAVVLTVLVGLGFASIENLYYVFDSANWTETAMLRALTAVPMHATVGIIMGYFAARYLVAEGNGLFLLVAMFAVPMLLHGFYDYPVFAIQQLLAVTDRPGNAAYAEFQGIFIAAIAASALAAMAVFRAVANSATLTGPAPWFRTAAIQDQHRRASGTAATIPPSAR